MFIPLLVYCFLFACLLFIVCLLLFLFACLLFFVCLFVEETVNSCSKRLKMTRPPGFVFFPSLETINVHACLFLCLFSVFVCLFIVYCLLVYCLLFACLLFFVCLFVEEAVNSCSERYADLRSLLCNQASQLEVTSSPDPIFQMAEPGHCPGNLAALKLLMTRLTWKMKCNQRKRSGLLSNSLPVCLPGKGSQ